MRPRELVRSAERGPEDTAVYRLREPDVCFALKLQVRKICWQRGECRRFADPR
jgi:hypothetical protein